MAWACVVLLAGSGGAWAQNPAPTTAAISEEDKQNAAANKAVAAEKALSEIKATHDLACKDADVADARLAAEFKNLNATTRTLRARQAQALRDLCDDEKTALVGAEKSLRAAQSELRKMLLAFDVTKAGAAGTGNLVDLVKAGREAQAEVEKQKAAARKLFELIDEATAAAMALKSKDDQPLVNEAKGLQAKANDAVKAARKAQSKANEMVEAALVIKHCQLDKTKDCAQAAATAYAEGNAARAQMDEQINIAKSNVEKVTNAAAQIIIAKEYDDPADRANALAFRKLLEKYPLAGAPFTKDGVTLLASAKEKKATLVVSGASLLSHDWRRWALRISSPLGDDGEGQPIRYARSGVNQPSFGLSYDWGGGKFLGKKSLLRSFSLGANVSYTDETYRSADLGADLTDKATKTRYWPTNVYLAGVVHDTTTSNAHLLRLAYQRQYEAKTKTIRCPAGGTGSLAVNCVSASFGAPSLSEEGVVTYEYRYKGSDFAFSPSVTHNWVNRVTEVGMPIYLVKSADDDKRPLTGGLRIDWRSKPKNAAPTDKNEWSIGVFVGAAFSLFSRAE